MLWGNRNLIKDEELIICSLPVVARSRGDKEEIKGRGGTRDTAGALSTLRTW